MRAHENGIRADKELLLDYGPLFDIEVPRPDAFAIPEKPARGLLERCIERRPLESSKPASSAGDSFEAGDDSSEIRLKRAASSLDLGSSAGKKSRGAPSDGAEGAEEGDGDEDMELAGADVDLASGADIDPFEGKAAKMVLSENVREVWRVGEGGKVGFWLLRKSGPWVEEALTILYLWLGGSTTTEKSSQVQFLLNPGANAHIVYENKVMTFADAWVKVLKASDAPVSVYSMVRVSGLLEKVHAESPSPPKLTVAWRKPCFIVPQNDSNGWQLLASLRDFGTVFGGNARLISCWNLNEEHVFVPCGFALVATRRMFSRADSLCASRDVT